MIVFQIILLFTVSGIIKSLTSNKQLWKSFATPQAKGAAGIVLVLMLITGTPVFAQGGAEEANTFVLDSGLENLLLVMNGVLLLAIIYLLSTLRGLVTTLSDADKTAEELVADKGWFGRIMFNMTDAVPVEDEEEILTDHDYDGIQELDNNLPPWWVMGFYITIACAVVYIGYYEFYMGGNISKQEYQAEMKAAEEAKEAYLASLGNSIDESNVEILVDAGAIAKGKDIYDGNCVACHGGAGEGGVGPNLTDEYWLHGGGIKEVFKTIKYGVPAKGMIPWEDQLTPPQMQQVASYIMTLKGTNPPNPKEPQGEVWVEEEGTESTEEEAPADSTVVVEESEELAATAQ
jgi:cytochrome c oxidase cbb3-type subunit 3